MLRLTIFIIAILLLAGAVDASRGWFIALTVLSGLQLFRIRPWRMFGGRTRHYNWSWRSSRWAEEPDW
jgi:hypothetical protein